MFKAKDFSRIAIEKQRVMPVAVNPLETRPTTASDRLKAFAEERGQVDEAGNTDLSGLHLQQEDLEYVVNQHVVNSETDEPVIKERDWRLPRRGDPDRRPRNFGRSSQRGGHGIEKTSAIDLDVLGPDKKLLASLQFGNQDQFYAFVDSHGPEEERDAFEKSMRKLNFHLPIYLRNREGNTPLPRGPIDLDMIWWEDKAGPKVPAEIDAEHHMRIQVPLHNKDDRFGDVLRHREYLELTGELPGASWLGLTIAFGARKLQIVQDSMRDSSEPPGMKSGRVFKIAEYNESGNEFKQNGERVYTFNDLQELINGSKFTDMYWEVAVTPEEFERAMCRRLGWLATPEFTTPAEEAAEKAAAALDLALLEEHIKNETASIERGGLHAVGGRNPARAPKLSKERRTAIWLLSSVNAETKEASQSKMRHIATLSAHKEHVRHHLETLEHIIEEQGLVPVFKLSLSLEKTFAACAKGLRLPLNETSLGDTSWVMDSLASQHHADMRHGVDPKVHSPFGDTLEARHRQHVIGDMHLGTVAAATVIRSKKNLKEAPERAGVADAKEAALDNAKPGDKIDEKAVRMVETRYVDPLFAVSLPDFMKDEALEILQRVIEKDPKLGPHDYIQLGALLRRAADTER